VETAVQFQATEWWRWRTGYSWLEMNLADADGVREGSSPSHQVFLISQMDLPHNLTLDLGYRYVSRLPAQMVAAYSALDARLAWAPRPNFEVALVGQNLLDSQHPEFGGSRYTGSVAAEVPRSVYATMTWRY
jgi:iron complex outermembrane receptor protein